MCLYSRSALSRGGALLGGRWDCIMKSSSHASSKCTGRGKERMCHYAPLCSKSQASLSYPSFSSHMVWCNSTSGSCPLISKPVVVGVLQRDSREEKICPFFFLFILLYRRHQSLKSQTRLINLMFSCRSKI